MEINIFILLFLIGVVLIILGVHITEDGLGEFGVVIVGIALLGIFINIGILIHGRTFDDKIEMYEEENLRIEQSVNVLVKDYYKHESDTYSSLKPENAVLFASAYPELQGNDLAMKQLVDVKDVVLGDKKPFANLNPAEIPVELHTYSYKTIRDCHKCVYEVGCHGNPVGCKRYKRDALDGGYYG